uniref:Cytochrome c oxidase subunit 2 n=1 Tax=Oncicola luehei TaxID=1100885 RepID=H2E2E3_9BILA|nr:cytochrome c oxidase subunit II [Oncicola luehei]AER42902.1 cytochrome c oxidase subunit 2 [Oncicola luehei]
MMEWGKMGMFDGLSVFMEKLVGFNDFMMVLSLVVVWFVLMLMFNELVLTMLNTWDMESVMVEFIWTVLPLVLLGFMAYPSMVLLYMYDEGKVVDLIVKVVGHQWYWEYESYLSGGSSYESYMEGAGNGVLYRLLDVDNRLVLPLFSSVQLLITSSDVVHSWALPSMGVKVDAIPGIINQVTLNLIVPGVMYGQCSELCGVNHSFMPIVLEVVSMVDYLSWVVGK